MIFLVLTSFLFGLEWLFESLFHQNLESFGRNPMNHVLEQIPNHIHLLFLRHGTFLWFRLFALFRFVHLGPFVLVLILL